MYLVSFNKYFIFLQVGRPYNASGETLSSVPGNMHIRVQYCFLLITVLNSQRPPSISSCSASAYTDNLTVVMLYEILAWMANMERKVAEWDQKAIVDWLEMEYKAAVERLEMELWNAKSQQIGWN